MPKKVVVIGASTGGPLVIEGILSNMLEDFPAAILIAQHMPPKFTREWADHLNKKIKIRVKEAEEGDLIEKGVVYIAPGDHHMIVEKIKINKIWKVIIKLNKNPKVNRMRPSIDVLMGSVSEIYQRNVIGVLLTGMGEDGVEGMKAIKKLGGATIAQNKATSAVYGMPKAVDEIGIVDYVLPFEEISKKIVEMVEN